MMRDTKTSGLLALAVVAGLTSTGPVRAAGDVTITPLLRTRATTCLLELDGVVYGGTDGGGLARWSAASPAADPEIWEAGATLTGNYVSDLAWTGRNLWVATLGAGLTRVTDPGGVASFRPFANDPDLLTVTAVTGAVIGDQERVWYAIAGRGVAEVVNGIVGAPYTAERDGLIANDVTTIAMLGTEVFFGTAVGVSRFANNLFTTVNDGLGSLVVDDLAVDPTGTLLAAGPAGVFTWDGGVDAWSLLGTPGWRVNRLAWHRGQLVVLGSSGGEARLAIWDGTAFVSEPLPFPEATALAGGDDVWVGGRERRAGMGNRLGFAWLGRRLDGGGYETWSLDRGPLVGDAEGVTFGNDGRAWLGSWWGQGLSGLLDDDWLNVWEIASADNDSSGLINQNGNVLCMATGVDGIVWAGQFNSGGLLRHDPASGRTDQVVPGNSGLGGRRILNIVVHPDGPLLLLHDAPDVDRVEVLVDPLHWRDPGSWISLPTGTGGLGDGPRVWDAHVERRDVVWFAVEETGLVRWDINGKGAGPDDPLTWYDQSDDHWDEPVAAFAFAGPVGDPRQAKALAAGPSGSIWVGGDGLVRFRYDVETSYVTVVTSLRQKESPGVEGLLGGGVNDLATDADGAVWAVNASGLNRVTLVEGKAEVEAWTDLMNFVGNPSYGGLYSSNVVTPLPGFLYRRIAAEPGGRRLLVSGDRGAALVEPASGGGGGPEALAGLYVYPNPWCPDLDGDGLLRFGGVDTGAEKARVRIYTVEGLLVFPREDVAFEVSSGEGFWDGTRDGSPVATGVYLLQVTLGDAVVLRPVAIVR